MQLWVFRDHHALYPISFTVFGKTKVVLVCYGRKMRTDTMIRSKGMKALREKLDIVEAEKFISLILREDFDVSFLNFIEQSKVLKSKGFPPLKKGARGI